MWGGALSVSEGGEVSSRWAQGRRARVSSGCRAERESSLRWGGHFRSMLSPARGSCTLGFEKDCPRWPSSRFPCREEVAVQQGEDTPGTLERRRWLVAVVALMEGVSSSEPWVGGETGGPCGRYPIVGGPPAGPDSCPGWASSCLVLAC